MISGKRCCSKDSRGTKTQESLADFNRECEQNRNVTNFLVSRKNLYRRDANGQMRRSYLFITPKISRQSNTTIFCQSANSISRKENCSKITEKTIRDLGFHRMEAGIFFPSGGDFSALRLAESRRLAALSGNSYLNDSDIFKARLHKIQNRTDRFLRAFPTPSQTLEYSKYIFKQMHDGELDQERWFLPLSTIKIYDVNWTWRHETENTNRTLNARHNFFLLPPMLDLLMFNENNFRWSLFLGEEEEAKANRLLRDRIVSRLYDNIENEIG